MNHQFWDLLREIESEHWDDIDGAVDAFLEALQDRDDYEEFVADAVKNTARRMIQIVRHNRNSDLRGTGQGSPPKVVVGRSAAVEQSAKNYYSYCLAGRSLGAMTGNELPDAAQHEWEVGQGHIRNAKLARKVYDAIPKTKRHLTVKETVSQKKLAKIFEEIGNTLTDGNGKVGTAKKETVSG